MYKIAKILVRRLLNNMDFIIYKFLVTEVQKRKTQQNSSYYNGFTEDR
jgi:hypothetical protein